MTDINSDGRAYRIAGLIWCQGEYDADRIWNELVTKSEYKYSTIDVLSWFRNIVGNSSLPIFISQIGYRSNCFDIPLKKAAYEQVQDAQEELCETEYNYYMGFNRAKEFFSLNCMSDTVHYNEKGYRMMGESLAEKAAAVVGG